MKITDIPHGSVVAGIDGSPGADAALDWAAHEASLEGHPLVLLYSLPPNLPWSAQAIDPVAVREATAEDARRVLAAARDRVRPVIGDDDVVALRAFVDPRSSLVTASERARMLVLGSRGRGSVASLLLGSVSAAVSQRAACPVVVVRPRTRVTSHFAVVAIDGTPESLVVLETAFRHASLRRLPLRVLHYTGGIDGPTLEEARLLLAESLAGYGEKFPDVPVSQVVGTGMIEEALAAAADVAELTVVGRHARHGPGRWLRTSVATAVVEHAHGTVMSVPVPEAGGTS